MPPVLVEHEAMVDAVPKALLVDAHAIKLLARQSALAGLAQHLSTARSADEVFHDVRRNAVRSNDRPREWVDLGALPLVLVEITPVSTCYVRATGIGIRPHHIPMFKRLHPRNDYAGLTEVCTGAADAVLVQRGHTA